MATEPKTLFLQIDPDARLAAAVGGAARYIADAAGLESAAIAPLQSSVVAACCESFEHLTGIQPHLDVTLTRFSDRIEVALSYRGEASPAIGLDTIAGLAAQSNGAANSNIFNGVDRVQYETHGAEAVTRLTKYIVQENPNS